MKKILAVLVTMITILMVGGVALAATEEISWNGGNLQCDGVDCTSLNGETACYMVYYVDQNSNPACYVVYYVPGEVTAANLSIEKVPLEQSGK